MSQYANPYGDPEGQQWNEPRRTSGMAITALVLSILGIVPCCGIILAPIGVLLGLIGTFRLGPQSPMKGRGLALAAVVIGVICIAAQIGGGVWIYREIGVPMVQGPQSALTEGFAGNISGFKASMFGAGQNATDAEAQAFIEQLRARYGEFVSSEWDQTQPGAQPQAGQTEMVLPYKLQFTNQTVDAEVMMIFADQATGLIMKPEWIRIIDPQNGDLTFPASSAPPASTGSTSTPAPVPTTTDGADGADGADADGGDS